MNSDSLDYLMTDIIKTCFNKRRLLENHFNKKTYESISLDRVIFNNKGWRIGFIVQKSDRIHKTKSHRFIDTETLINIIDYNLGEK